MAGLKTCSVCRVEKPASEFYKRAARPSGDSRCKRCRDLTGKKNREMASAPSAVRKTDSSLGKQNSPSTTTTRQGPSGDSSASLGLASLSDHRAPSWDNPAVRNHNQHDTRINFGMPVGQCLTGSLNPTMMLQIHKREAEPMPRAKMHEVPKEPVTFNIHPDVTRWLEVQAAMNNISRSQQAENVLRFAIKLQNRHLHGEAA